MSRRAIPRHSAPFRAFLSLALRGRVAWDVQARHTLGYALRRLRVRLASPRLWNAVRLLLAIAAALVVLPFFLLFGEDRVEEYDPAYDLD